MPGISSSQTDTLVCDNGGFESGFTYYYGSYATYYNGGDNCLPLDINGNPSTWSSISIPASGRFAIVNSGTDPLVGIATTKFGSKAARINNYLGHTFPQCSGHRDANKLIKRFKVNNDNREFTFWYAAVLENPNGHTNSQPFFSITCDLAPNSDLCFDASELSCPEIYEHTCNFDSIQVVDWTCHRISIPESEIGNIATVEIIASDCGCSAHFGYAYIDGFCEDCTGSADGSGDLSNDEYDYSGIGIKSYTCDGNYVTVCGKYSLPYYCTDEWTIDSILVPGYSINNLNIDTTNKKFCFDLPKSNFEGDTCRKLYVELFFSNQSNKNSIVNSNTITICPEQFRTYNINNLSIGSCNDNSTSSILSDDYYYVSFNIGTNYGDPWTITRILYDPYPGEQGIYEIRTGYTAGSLSLGPFLIQEGDWEMIIDFGDCSDTVYITPPDFCSGCTSFWEAKISNISCNNQSTNSPNDDTWSFDINVPGPSGQSFQITGIGSKSFNNTHTISMGTINAFCAELELIDPTVSPQCYSKIVVCPPHPCSDNNCTLEAYVKELDCPENNGNFNVKLDVQGASTGYLCYTSYSKSDPTNALNANNQTGSVPSNKILGPFTEDVYIIIYQCSTSACTCVNTRCFKALYVPILDCEDDDFQGSSTRTKLIFSEEVYIIPNPLINNRLTIKSSLEITEFEILDVNYLKLYSSTFKNSEYSFELNLLPGVYFLKFKDLKGKYKVKKFIRF